MNKQLLNLEKEFGNFGSWALWDKNGNIEGAIENKKLESLIKPNIIFVGLNASYDLRTADKWKNFHYIANKKNSSWKKEHCRKLADVLCEPEFLCFRGAYMTDIIKNDYNSNSIDVTKTLERNEDIISENIKLFKREMELLSGISEADSFFIICMGNDAFNLTIKAINNNVYKIVHYSSRGSFEAIKEKIRRDLKKIILPKA
jgi:hypothetical protein